MVRFSNKRDLKDWLSDKDPLWALVLSVRTAARSLPYYIMSEGQRSQAWLMIRIIFFSHLGLKSNFSSAQDNRRVQAITKTESVEVNITLHQRILQFTSLEGFDLKASDFLLELLESCSEHGHIADHINGILMQENDIDSTSLIEGLSPQRLISLPLWRPSLDNPFSLAFKLYKEVSLQKDPKARFWFDWYQSLLDGKDHPNLTSTQQALIYNEIAKLPEELWTKGPKEVNAHIYQLLSTQRAPASKDGICSKV